MEMIQMENLEKLAGKISPVGFTPFLSLASGQVLKYDFRGIGPRVIDKSGSGNYGVLKPNWPKDAPWRTIVPTVPLTATVKMDGENDFIQIPFREPSMYLDGSFKIEITVDFESFKNKDGMNPIIWSRERNAYGFDVGYHAGIDNLYAHLDYEGGRNGVSIGIPERDLKASGFLDISMIYNEEESKLSLEAMGKKAETNVKDYVPSTDPFLISRGGAIGGRISRVSIRKG